jgi:ABC-type lipoprotein export system ATPase subunit
VATLPNRTFSWAIKARALTRRFDWSGGTVTAVDGVDLDVGLGEKVALVGPSGSGKTTLLNLIGGLDRPTSGSLDVLGNRLDEMSEPDLTSYRANSVGIVFQNPQLLAGFTALDNVVLSQLPWRPLGELKSEAGLLLEEVGLVHRLNHAPGRMSGGERQRVGIARALMGSPRLLIADEPTGNLDLSTAASIVALVRELCAARKMTLLVATHDPSVASIADRVLHLSGGRVNVPPQAPLPSA